MPANDAPRSLDYADATLVSQFDMTVREFGDRPATDFFGRVSTWSHIDDGVGRVAAALRAAGIGKGDVVAVLLPTCPQNLVVLEACARIGAICAQHNPLYTVAELRGPFADHGARIAFCWDKAAPALQKLIGETALETIVAVDLIEELPLLKRLALRLPLKEVRAARAKLGGPAPDATRWRDFTGVEPSTERTTVTPDDVAVLLFTSGTSGTPKGVPLTHRNLAANVIQGRAWVPGIEPGKETVLTVLPMFHAYGLTVSVLLGVSWGACLLMVPSPDVSLIMDAITRRKPAFLPAVPPVYERILDLAAEHKVSLDGIRYSLSGAMPLWGELIERWESQTGGLLIEGYGLTETGPVIAGNPLDERRRAGSIGIPFPDTEIRLADPANLDQDVPDGEPGELLVRGPQVFAGYLDRPEETEAAFHDGWFRTGDLAVRADDGFLTIVDRIKEVIISGGFNVYPSEVEEVLMQHGSVLDVAVIGLERSNGSEEVVAAVVSEESPDAESLRTHCKESLTPYKVPRRFVRVDELPKNQMGKIQRRQVRDLIDKPGGSDQPGRSDQPGGSSKAE